MTTAEEIKDALRRRHPAYDANGVISEWTTLEEWLEIDLLAVSAWASARNVGYEVKVSRSDYRRELLKPSKRALAVSRCHEFYFAVPKGLLKPEEIAFTEPAWEPQDFVRARCPGIPSFGAVVFTRGDEDVCVYGGPCERYRATGPGYHVTVPVPFVGEHRRRLYSDLSTEIVCPTCGGKGYTQRSRVEREAPTLWVPADVGLIEVSDSGRCHVTKRAPTRKPDNPIVSRESAQIVRWVSVRPDPRHRGARIPS